jgi:NodT family efflux transporter outer membrane factor (OMF) lipoprotein
MYLNKASAAVLLVVTTTLIAGCTSPSVVGERKNAVVAPENWGDSTSVVTVSDFDNQWLNTLVSADVRTLIQTAIDNNFDLQNKWLTLQATKKSVEATGATLWPSLEMGFSTAERKTATSDGSVASNDLSLTLRYEVDIWGKLSANEKQLNFSYLSQKASYEQARKTLISNVILSWYGVVEAKLQLQLSEQRLTNAKQNLDIIEAGYESGLNSALDVYLSRNDVASEQARVYTQRTAYTSSVRTLEQLLGRYPAGTEKVIADELPEVDTDLSANVPSEVVASNPEIQSAWYTLLAKDAGLAYAHKQRFPSLSLTANLGQSSEALSDLLSSTTTWSILGNLTAPLFNAGRLEANQEKAEFEALAAEQSYLQLVNQTFASIENTLTEIGHLNGSFEANKQAAENAQIAETLSFEQYVKGLVDYTTVLDAQTRAYSAKSAEISTRFSIIESKMKLHIALGGNFDSIIGSDK